MELEVHQVLEGTHGDEDLGRVLLLRGHGLEVGVPVSGRSGAFWTATKVMYGCGVEIGEDESVHDATQDVGAPIADSECGEMG